MSTIGPAGTGIISGSAHPTKPNLWVRELDNVISGTQPPLILTGVIKGMTDNAIDTTANTYAHGCLLTQVDGVTGLSATWENIGSSASPSWQRWEI